MNSAVKSEVVYVWVLIALGLLAFWAFALGGLWSLVNLVQQVGL